MGFDAGITPDSFPSALGMRDLMRRRMKRSALKIGGCHQQQTLETGDVAMTRQGGQADGAGGEDVRHKDEKANFPKGPEST
jgi:hypothetical protein